MVLNGERKSLTLVGGYRATFLTHLFLDVGIGGGIAKIDDDGNQSYTGFRGAPRHEKQFQFDGTLALGSTF